MIKKLLFILLISTPCWLIAQPVFEFNSTCQQAFQEITRLKINSGKQLIQKARQQNPDNLIPELLDNYIDFYTLFLNEDPAELRKRLPNFELRLNKIKQGPTSSPFYFYCQSMILLQRAAAVIKAGKFLDAAWDCRRSYLLIKENKKNFPTFSPNDLPYGTLQAVTGTVPKGYRWIAGILGMKGSLTEGMKTIRNFVNGTDPWQKVFFNEAAYIYPYLLFYLENKKEEALQFTRTTKIDLVNNHLHLYMAVNLCINNQQAEQAANLILNRTQSSDYLNTAIWDVEMGFAQLYHLQTTQAARYFEKFLEEFKGKFYVKDVYQKLSWCYWLEGNKLKAEQMRQAIFKKGSTDSDADKKALADARTGIWPNKWLLKARLLCDGGFLTEALKILMSTPDDPLDSEAEKLEWVYRKARVFDGLGRTEEALQNYTITIRLGENSTSYYAARAALQTGQIYENRGNKALAIQYYQQCLNMENHEYKNSLDQRAKSGIARCKGE
ncbi:MAG: tetratricopeptide repeat protein [Chitinophagia bacterium]|jgi:tetratricopeptide (TPR) repeat protein|nr:tetratricopeptide repeat protein [Chitinophagia bacterium]